LSNNPCQGQQAQASNNFLFSRKEIELLQPRDVAKVLAQWRTLVGACVGEAAGGYNESPSLESARTLGTFARLDQVFSTTIPAVELQREGWRDKLRLLLAELEAVGLLTQ
jgi:hypothetical protein